MNLPNRCHPERSEGSFATEAQAKDPVSIKIDVRRQFHGILRLRYARLSASAPLRMTHLFGNAIRQLLLADVMVILASFRAVCGPHRSISRCGSGARRGALAGFSPARPCRDFRKGRAPS